MFSTFRKAREAPKELNVLPVMNLMVTLIPFLLLGASFYKIAVIPATIPSHDTSAEADLKPPSDEIITLNLILEVEQIRLSASSATVAPEVLDTFKSVVPLAGGLDAAQLTEAVFRFKRAYPKSDTVLLLPAPQIPYQLVVAVIDATHERSNKGKKRALFPVVVFSERIAAEENPDGGVPETGEVPE